MEGRQSALREEHLIYTAAVLLLTWSGTVLLWGAGHLSYGAARRVALPIIPLVSLIALLDAWGRREGWVTPMPGHRGDRAIGVLASCLVTAMAATMAAVLV